jgi:hypothetical protein
MVADPASFAKLVPGFDFLQNLVKGAGSALPSIGQWVAPTLDPQELEKRIEELRTVQFWLEQNARMLGATIQALEVQRMTLSTLKTMNVQLDDLREAMKIKPPAAAPAPAPAAKLEPSAGSAEPARKAPAARKAEAAPEPPAAAAAGVVDPMQWWGALTRQFGELAANALKDSTTDAAKNLGAAMVRQSIDAAGDTLRKAAGMPAAVARGAADAMAAGASAARGGSRKSGSAAKAGAAAQRGGSTARPAAKKGG